VGGAVLQPEVQVVSVMPRSDQVEYRYDGCEGLAVAWRARKGWFVPGEHAQGLERCDG
jgi:hypothetical protein